MTQETREIATLGGGCFWCIEAIYDDIQGVSDVVSGYSGGAVRNPSYEAVCGGRTGHAEVIQVQFDPNQISFREILEIFFSVHDPTTLNRQGADVGTQYRSAIFTHSPEQAQTARELITELNAKHTFSSPIVTEVTPFDTFYPAEEYHQDYFANHPNQPYCRVVVAPKVNKFRKSYQQRLKTQVA